jgi:hypothetical protein
VPANITDDQLSDGIPKVSLSGTFGRYDPPGNDTSGVNLVSTAYAPFLKNTNYWETVRDNTRPVGILSVVRHDSSCYAPAAFPGVYLPGKLFSIRYFVDSDG